MREAHRRETVEPGLGLSTPTGTPLLKPFHALEETGLTSDLLCPEPYRVPANRILASTLAKFPQTGSRGSGMLGLPITHIQLTQ